MQEVAQELHAIKLAQDEVMKAERQSFQIELKRVREKLEQVETKSKSLEDEIRPLKAKNKTLERHPSPSILAAKKVPILPSSSKAINGVKAKNPTPKNYAQIVVSNVTQSALDKPWTEVINGNQKRKGTPASSPKTEPESEHPPLASRCKRWMLSVIGSARDHVFIT